MQPTSVDAPKMDSQPQQMEQQQQWIMMQQQQQHQPWMMLQPLTPRIRPRQPQPQPQLMVQHQPQPQLMVQHNPEQVDKRILWIGDLQYWMDDTYLHNCFSPTKSLLAVNIIRNMQSGESEGFGFLEFVSHAAAKMTLQNYNGLRMPKAEQRYRLNWPAFGSGEKGPEDYTIFVGNLAPDVTDNLLQETFGSRYHSVKEAKVIIDNITRRSKGYGFVRFGNEKEKARAIIVMNGMLCSSRPMRVEPVTSKKTTVYQQPFATSENDPNNTTCWRLRLDYYR